MIEPAVDGGISRVRDFREKPGAEAARALLGRGWLWNTFVLVAKVAIVIEAAAAMLPDLHKRLMAAGVFAGTKRERWAVEQLYASVPAANFSHSVLQAEPGLLAVSTLPPLLWSDLGTPARLFKLLRVLGIRPAWLGSGGSMPLQGQVGDGPRPIAS
jgi:mannose-1-phosphate guanylyltransferase